MSLNGPYAPGQIIESGLVNQDLEGLADGQNDTDNNSLKLFRSEAFEDFFLRGTGVWSAASGLTVSATQAVYYMNSVDGTRVVAGGVGSYSVANDSKTYIDYTQAGTITYTVTTLEEATDPDLAAGSIRAAVITASNGSVTNIIQRGLDNKGNYIYNLGAVGRDTASFDVGLPVGSLTGWAGMPLSAPTGWLICNGQAVSRATYSSLYEVIKSSWGSGDGVSTFNVPDFRQRVLVGYDGSVTEFNSVGKTGGESRTILTWGQMPVHNHGVSDGGHGHALGGDPVYTSAGGTQRTYLGGGTGQQLRWGAGGVQNSGTGISINNAGGGQSHNNLPPYGVGSWIIKAY